MAGARTVRGRAKSSCRNLTPESLIFSTVCYDNAHLAYSWMLDVTSTTKYHDFIEVVAFVKGSCMPGSDTAGTHESPTS